MGKYWSPLKSLSTWRKISVGMWDPPANPTIYGFETFNVEDLLNYLKEVEEVSGVRVSPAVIATHAFSQLFGDNPGLNVMVVNQRIQQRKSVDAFMQVAMKGDNGDDLSGVTIRQSNELDIVQLSEVLTKKAMKVRKGQDHDIEQQKKSLNLIPIVLMRPLLRFVEFLTFNVPVDLDGLGIRSDPFGSFMVSSVAPFDIRLGFAPLVPASRCPLVALPGAIFEAPMVVDGEVKVCRVMQMGVTFDHRCFDGAQIGIMARKVRQTFERPREVLPDPSYWADHEPIIPKKDHDSPDSHAPTMLH